MGSGARHFGAEFREVLVGEDAIPATQLLMGDTSQYYPYAGQEKIDEIMISRGEALAQIGADLGVATELSKGGQTDRSRGGQNDRVIATIKITAKGGTEGRSPGRPK